MNPKDSKKKPHPTKQPKTHKRVRETPSIALVPPLNDMFIKVLFELQGIQRIIVVTRGSLVGNLCGCTCHPTEKQLFILSSLNYPLCLG